MAQVKKYSKQISMSEVRWKLVGVIVLTFISTMLVMPHWFNRGIDAVNSKVNLGLPRLPEKNFNLGLDLQGGAHLIYKADTSRVAPADKASAVEGVRDVIERRVRGGLGVSEPLVQTTQVGQESRIIVELPGITDVHQAIQMIGETPVLEFKEENKEPARDLTADELKQMNAYNASSTKKSKEALLAIRKGLKFEDAVQKYSDDTQSKANGGDVGWITTDDNGDIADWAAKHKDGEVTADTIKSPSGLSIVKRLGARAGEKQVGASHILICYQGAEQCNNPMYTREQAKAKIEQLKNEVTPLNFSDYAKKYSTEPGAAQSAGDLGLFKKGQMVEEFEKAIWDVPANTVIGPVETKFGFHLIYKRVESVQQEYHIAHIFFKLQQKSDIVPPQDQWRSTGLSGKQLSRAEVTEDSRTGQVQVALQFNDEGKKLFADITTRNTNKVVGIFLDGQPISTPRVNEPITTGNAVISGSFSYNEAKLLAQRLNSGALPIPVEILSQQKVDATLGADSLAKSFKAGLAGLVLVMVFMAIYYRLPGLLSVVSLAVYALLNLAIFKVLGVTLTLSGIAGFILSIGMAVDANVLVFERLKEELRAGRSLLSALEESFLRAWPSIRDSHVTTLISCLLLIWFGSGFIQGFAVVLATGVLMSLFTAITVTRTIMRIVFPLFKKGANALFLGYKKPTSLDVE